MIVAALMAAVLGASAGPPPGTRSAHSFGGTPTVGALFPSATSSLHFCTASVVASPRGDVLISAAHCQSGEAAGEIFVPGFRDGSAPYGRWRVTGAHYAPGWLHGRSDRRDWTFLTVAPRRIHGRWRQIQQVTGADALAPTVRAGTTVTVPAYNNNADRPIICRAPLRISGGFASFNCASYISGSSGAPFLVPTRHGGMAVVGVIGGPHQGGCEPWTSYASPRGRPAEAVLGAASRGAAPQRAPALAPDGCAAVGSGAIAPSSVRMRRRIANDEA